VKAYRSAWSFVLLALLGASGCRERDSSHHPRAVMFGLSATDPVQRHLADPTRLAVVYWPAIGGCGPCEVGVVQALSEVEAEHGEDTRVLTVVPPGAGDRFAEMHRLRWPGTVVEMALPRYEAQRAIGPLPRVEVWSAAGDLLLLRSLPANLAAGQLLAEEILWCRSFTAPLDVEGG
jgi:hypothetical protein